MVYIKYLFLVITFGFVFIPNISKSQTNNILMFVSHENTYYSEYVVIYEAFKAKGYSIDVRSSSSDSASTYMIPNGTDIIATANSLVGSSYGAFQTQFQDMFDSNWNSNYNSVPNYIAVNGRIQDVVNMDNYDALIVAGGTGVVDYRVDGSYSSQGTGGRLVSALEVQNAAEKLNDLAIDALTKGKPVLAQCHGASLPVYWRIPGTNGSGAEALGFSLLKNNNATGYPDAQTPISLNSLNVTYREDDKVVVSSVHDSLVGSENGASKLITSRDWYPQTVAHAARTIINILETYPAQQDIVGNVSVLILHGGELDSTNCGPGNRMNDVPCNYGGGANLPADYTHLKNLLAGNSPNDMFSFTVTDVDITDVSLPYSPNSQSSIEGYFSQFDVIIFFKHWNTSVNAEIQNALVNYADNGGGVLALHHGLYNDNSGGFNKNIIVNQLFGAESAQATWSASLTNYNLFNTNYGHFISTFGVNFDTVLNAPTTWSTTPLLPASNSSLSYYQNFKIYDELYNNMTFVSGQMFGREVNEITPLFSNNQSPSIQNHTAGFVKLFDLTNDGTVGKAAFFQVGERKESLNINHPFGQVVRNSVVWLSVGLNQQTVGVEKKNSSSMVIYPNPVDDSFFVKLSDNRDATIEILTLEGKLIHSQPNLMSNETPINITYLKTGVYLVRVKANNTCYTSKLIVN